MTEPRRTPILAALLVLVTGCTSTGGPAGGMPSETGAAAGSTSSPGTVGPESTPSVTSRASSSACPSTGAAAIPDGTWAGALVAKVRASAPESGTRGKGTGVLQVVVEHGRVTGGTWALTWDSAGPSTAKDSQAKVRLHGHVAGKVTGTGAEPEVGGRWVVTGTAAVSSPVTATAAIDQAGQGRTTLSVRTTGCDSVEGTFAPSFRSTDAYGSSDATVRWTGRRTG